MSHRIDVQTKITNKKAAIQALQNKKWAFQEMGSQLKITDGPMRGASIHLKNGDVVGDTDFHKSDTLCSLNAAYAEALIMDDIARQNGVVQSRNVLSNGTVEILATMQLS